MTLGTKRAGGTARRRRTNDSGTSLIEVIVAIALIGVAMISGAGTLVKAVTSQRNAEATDRAVQLANDHLEQMRKLPWSQVGLWPTSPGYRSPVNGEQTVALTTAPTNPVLAPLTTGVGVNSFEVRTDITYATDPVTGLPGSPPYASKRITITVSWVTDTRKRQITDTTVRAPDLSEAVPGGMSAGGPVNTCLTDAAPFCRLWITTGQVLARNPGDNTSPVVARNPVQFTAQMSPTTGAATSVQATWGIHTFNLTSTDGGMTWYYLAGEGSTLLDPGDQTVTFQANTASGTITKTYTATWRMPIDAAADILPASGEWTYGSILMDTTRPAGSVSAPRGDESATSGICVDPTGHTYNYQALVFDTTNIDDMDGPSQPTVAYNEAPSASDPTSATEATLTAAAIAPPTLQTATYTIVNGHGYVTPTGQSPATARGATNTLRWAASIAKGTQFRAGANQASFVVSLVRPGDGVVVQATVNVDLVQQASSAGCASLVRP